MVEMKEIGVRIRARREYLGLTQQEMANKLSMSRVNYTRIEGGQVTVTAPDLATIADTLKVAVSYFYGDDDQHETDVDDVMMYYNGMPSFMRPAAKAALRAMYEQQDKEDEVTTVGKRAE